jgi:hypothetical protein
MAPWRRDVLFRAFLVILAALFVLFLVTSEEKKVEQFEFPLPKGFDSETLLRLSKQLEADGQSSPNTTASSPVHLSTKSSEIVQIASKRREHCDTLKNETKREANKTRDYWWNKGDLPPNPRVTVKNYKESRTIKDIDWHMVQLRSRQHKQDFVILVVSNKLYANITLNWLCVLKKNVPRLVEHVLLLTLDREFHSLLTSMSVMSVYISPNELLDTALLECSSSRYAFIWMLRLVVLHHLIDQGLDVIIMDSDAIILKDPMYLYTVISNVDKADAIFGRGKYPYDLGALWGYTACMGAAYFRSSAGTKHLLSEMSSINPFLADDQVRLNLALNRSGIQWPSVPEKGTLGGTVGRTPDGKLQVSLLPEQSICRYRCRRPFSLATPVNMDHVYIAHPLLLRAKKKESLKHMGLWLLKEEGLSDSESIANATNRVELIC